MDRKEAERAKAPERRVRGRALVAKVLDAAVAELARVGYEAMSVEDVAIAAGVAKTTLYRRWAHKRDIVLEAFSRLANQIPAPVDHGSFRADLVASMKAQREIVSQPAIRGLMRMSLGGPLHDDLAELGARLDSEKLSEARIVFFRAIARGEIPADVDTKLLQRLVAGVVNEIVLLHRSTVDDAQIERLADMVIDGVRRR